MSQVWPSLPLGAVLRRSEDTIELEPDQEYREVTVRLWGKGVVPRGTITGGEVAAQRRFLVRKGQFILSRIDARNGAFGLVPAELDGAIVSNDFPVFKVDETRLFLPFLGWMSRTAGFVEMCRRASEGTTNRVRLQEDRFLSLALPLPSVGEQRRIVMRIEEMAAEIDDARKLRLESESETVALQASVMRKTFTDCSGRVLELEDVCSTIIDNLHRNPQYADTGIPCIRSPDVGYGTLNIERALRTDEEEYERRIVRGAPQPDDIVLVREGGGTGKCALVMENQKFSLGQRVMMLRPNVKRVIPGFLLYQLLSPLVQEDQIMPLSKGSASPHLNIGALRRFAFRLPTLDEQSEIIARLDAFFAETNTLKQLQADTAAELEALLPTILDQAFTGSL